MSRSNIDITNIDKKHLWHHITQHSKLEETDPMILVDAKGMHVTDINGNTYLDALAGGVWTVNVGYGRESMGQAIHDQVVKIPFYSSAWGTLPAIELAEKVTELLPHMDRVYYTGSGSEANEKSYKMVRQRAHLYPDAKKHKIIYRDKDYHGSTIGALSSTGQEQRTSHYGPFLDGFVEMPHCCCYRCPFGKEYPSCNIECARSLEDIVKKEDPDTVGGIVLEAITAGGGVIPPVKEYFPIIAEICKKYDILLIIDEVVCGMGRTGKWFGHQHYDVKPDMISLAKGVASGYSPIALLVTTEDVFNLFKTGKNDIEGYFRDISTYGGCTSGMAAALENLNILKQEKLVENSKIMGDYLYDKLLELQDKHPIIGDVRAKGLFAGLELVENRDSKEATPEAKVGSIVKGMMNQGVIIGATNRAFKGMNNILTLSPALIAGHSEIDEIVTAIDNSLTENT